MRLHPACPGLWAAAGRSRGDPGLFLRPHHIHSRTFPIILFTGYRPYAKGGTGAWGFCSIKKAISPCSIKENDCLNQLCNSNYLEINNPGVVWRGHSPSMLYPQQRHARCEDEFLRSGACGARAKILSLRLCRPGFAAPGKQAGGLFSARTGR